MNKLERRLVSIVFLIIFVVVGFSLSINWYSGMGDNSTYSDITLSIAKTGRSTSQVLSTIIDYIFNEKLVIITPEKFTNLDLSTHEYAQNTMKFHFTPIQYVVAPLAKVIPINILWGNL